MSGSIRVYSNVEKSKFTLGADGVWVLKASDMIETS